MKLSQLITALLFCLLVRIEASAQYCAPQPYVNTKLVFDWTQLSWPIDQFNCQYCPGPTSNSVFNPFRTFVAGDASHLNVNNPIIDLSDYRQQDGWEMLYYGLNTQSQNNQIDNPFIVFYNKYRGVMRILVHIRNTQQAYNRAIIRLRFSNRVAGFEQGGFTIPSNPNNEITATLSSFEPKDSYDKPNSFVNQYPIWLFADVVVNYDPCVCLTQSTIELGVHLVENTDITLSSTGSIVERIGNTDNSSQPQQSAIERAAWNTTEFVNLATSGITKASKTYNDVSKGFESFVSSYKKQHKKLEDEFKQLGSPKNYTGIRIPDWIGEVAGFISPYVSVGMAVASFFDMSKGTTASTLKVSDITLKTNGSLNVTHQYVSRFLATPGSIQQDDNGSVGSRYLPLTNNPMGIVSLVENPIIEYIQFDPSPIRYLSYTSILNNPYGGEVARYYLPSIKQFRLKSPIRYVINPASGLELVDMKVSFYYDINDYDHYSGGFQYNGNPLLLPTSVGHPLSKMNAANKTLSGPVERSNSTLIGLSERLSQIGWFVTGYNDAEGKFIRETESPNHCIGKFHTRYLDHACALTTSFQVYSPYGAPVDFPYLKTSIIWTFKRVNDPTSKEIVVKRTYRTEFENNNMYSNLKYSNNTLTQYFTQTCPWWWPIFCTDDVKETTYYDFARFSSPMNNHSLFLDPILDAVPSQAGQPDWVIQNDLVPDDLNLRNYNYVDVYSDEITKYAQNSIIIEGSSTTAQLPPSYNQLPLPEATLVAGNSISVLPGTEISGKANLFVKKSIPSRSVSCGDRFVGLVSDPSVLGAFCNSDPYQQIVRRALRSGVDSIVPVSLHSSRGNIVFKIFPVPSQDGSVSIQFELENHALDCEVISSLGVSLRKFTGLTGNGKLSVRDLSPGTYLCRIGHTTKTFIVL